MRERGPGSGDRGPEAGETPAVVGRAPGKLHVVATPIGNLEDLSPRAARILAGVDLILAEDTRHVRKLLNNLGITTPARALHEHNEKDEAPRLLARLQAGDELALVSDAGTPLLSDPGYQLVRTCREAGIPVLAVPGPSAVTAALSTAGLPPYPFTFAGFLPARAGQRRAFLERLAALPHTVVLLLSPHRLAEELAACAESLGSCREAALCSEISKLHERCVRGSLAELAARDMERRGEHTLVIGPPVPTSRSAEVTAQDARQSLQRCLERGLSLQEARRAAAQELGIARGELYDLLKH
jgi:16S rRNA (cytidine1402-2'-O)-methyltransferase